MATVTIITLKLTKYIATSAMDDINCDFTIEVGIGIKTLKNK